MNGKVLLDTNIIIALFAKDEAVTTRLAASEEVFLSSIALGEYTTAPASLLTRQPTWRQPTSRKPSAAAWRSTA